MTCRCSKDGGSRGFTLIELLVVFVLIGLLLTIAVPRYLHSTETAKERVRAQNLSTLRDALDKFKSDQGRYPATLTELVQKQYLRQLPQDPVTQSDKWQVVAAPAGGEAGIYDVMAPVAEVEGTRADSVVPAATGADTKDAQ